MLSIPTVLKSTVLQNPAHTYSSNGSYYVCLTVSNAGGIDTFCDTVVVTGIIADNRPPVAVTDSAITIYPNPVQIDALNNDFDPDGDSIFYVIFISPLNGNVTHLGNASFEYEPNAGFRGVDSFHYVIRDNGNPNLRDTGTVVIRVEGLPFANFTFSSSGFEVQFENTSTGYDNVSWDLGDGDTATGNTVVHTYARGIYTVCLTATNSVGDDDTCKTVDLRTVGIGNIQKNDVKLLPNPAGREVKIQTEDLKLEKVELLDLGGKILLAIDPKSAISELVFDISSLPPGLFIFKLTGEEGGVMAVKLVKE